MKALEVDEEDVKKDPSRGTGKEYLEIEDILKKL
jgi:hypothetical protein